MRRQSPPTNRASEAKIIQSFRIVILDATRQYLALPRIRGDLKTLHLFDDVQQATFADELSARGNMLPAREPVHERGRGNSFNLFAQCAKRQPVDSGQQPSVTPLQFITQFVLKLTTKYRSR